MKDRLSLLKGGLSFLNIVLRLQFQIMEAPRGNGKGKQAKLILVNAPMRMPQATIKGHRNLFQVVFYL
ncbi:MAG: hypothetical protein IJC16_03785 [Rikenellaceae bacterium]|nr:hypothetical protein [Rikenellaceae bacterium]